MDKDPKYFYKTLAYAYALDITDKYIKNFESLVKEPPHWFVSNRGAFSMIVFSESLNDMCEIMSSNVSPPRSSGSGGGSFSGGGGAGGGGGGSW